MMVSHEYFNFLIDNGWKTWGLKDFTAQLDTDFVFSFLPKTLIFWVPAHTVTYSLPPELQITCAGVLAIVLGYFLSFAKRRRVEITSP